MYISLAESRANGFRKWSDAHPTHATAIASGDAPAGVDAEEEFVPGTARPAVEVEAGPFNVLFPARLVRQKDPLAMVAAAAALHDAGVDFHVHVVGEGELEPATREAVAAAGLDGRVLFHGSRADMPSWYEACDAVLLTSVFEGIPVVVYEAMAMGVPWSGALLMSLVRTW